MKGCARGRSAHFWHVPCFQPAIPLSGWRILMSVVPQRSNALFVLATLVMSLNGCAVIGGIFKAGMWAGVIAVALFIGLLFGVVRMLGGSG